MRSETVGGVATGCGSAYFSRFGPAPFATGSHRFAPAGLHKCSIPSPGSRMAKGRASLKCALVPARLDEAALVGHDNRLRSVVEVEFGEDACDVRFDGGVADDEFAGDVGVGEAARDEP